jgi:asparagine synthase (glutamine-hydrolysing)
VTALAGYWSLSERSDVDRSCAAMLRAQKIYAPDSAASGQWSDGQVAMGRRLFSLLPEDKYDRGPVVGEGGRVLVADIRLDNREELLSALNIVAGDGRLLSDTGLLMAALDRWDEAAIERLNGDFAFALWDPGRRRLLLARDFLGQRPLHFHRHKDFVAFASMPKGLHALPEVPRAPDSEALTRFLSLVPEGGSRSFFQGVERVEAGHVRIFTRAGVSARAYWQPSRTPLRLKRDDDYVDAVREALDRAVSARLRGTAGSVGTHLSGGLDSSAVAATAARLTAQGRVTAFTSVPGEHHSGPEPFGRFGDEGPLAAAVASVYPNIEHVLIRTGGKSPFTALDRNHFLFERPILNLCNGVWADAILDSAKQRRLNVMLTGSRGNMSFSYAGLELLPELLASGRLLSLSRQIAKLRGSGVRLESSVAHSIGPFLPGALWQAVNLWRDRRLALEDYSAVNPEAAAGLRSEAAAAGLDFSYRPRRDPFGTRLWVLRRVDTGNYNKGVLGGWGIDLRDPTADRNLVELCLSIPSDQFLKDGVPRSLARRVLADRLPPQVLEEKRKGLQAIDWHEGVRAAREEVREEVQRIMAVPVSGEVLATEKLEQLIDDWPSRGWTGDKVTKSYRLAMLRGVSAGHFLRKSTGTNA